MVELFNEYVSSEFLDVLGTLSPAVGFGLVLGLIIAIVGWLFGFVINASRLEL